MKVIDEDDSVCQNNEKLYLIDWKIRWMTFIYFFNILWQTILKQMYRKDIDMNSWETTTEHNKIFDFVKSFKHAVLKVMKILAETCLLLCDFKSNQLLESCQDTVWSESDA